MRRKHKEPMSFSGYINLRGCYKIGLYDAKTGELVNFQQVDNTVVTRGRREVLDIIRTGGHTSLFGWMAVGTGNTSPTTADTLLQSEISRQSIGTFTTANLTSNPPSWDSVASWNTNEANTTLGEVGLFNTSTANTQTMLARATFSTINKTTSNTLSITYTISN